MTNEEWKKFFILGRTVLGPGSSSPEVSTSWCAYTSFSAIRNGAQYWHLGFPDFEDILDTKLADGGVWRQVWHYDDLAHVVVPATFYWETEGGPKFTSGQKQQNIHLLSDKLQEAGVAHRLTDLVLEIKLY